MPKDIRAAGLERVRKTRARAALPALLTKTSSNSTHEPLEFSPPYTNGASEVVYPTASTSNPRRVDFGVKRRKTDEGEDSHRDRKRGDDVPVIGIPSDEEMDSSGWVRKKLVKSLMRVGGKSDGGQEWEGSAVNALGHFRLNLSLLK